MRDAIKLMFIPITGCIAIGLIFLLVVIGGKWDIVNEKGMVGLAIAELEAHDGILTVTSECDHDLYSPVCGFDGETYDNVCLAVQAGTRVAHRGQCGPR